MRSRQEIEAELREKEEMADMSPEMQERVGPYIDALEWVLEGESSQIGALRVSKFGRFDGALLAARTEDGKIFIEEESETDSIYSLLKYEMPSN